MTEDQLALLIPFGFFLLLGIIGWGFFSFRHKGRAELQQTIRQALDKGQELSPELVDRISEPKAEPTRDLRRGLIWAGLAIGTALFGIALPEEEATRVFLGVAAWPLMIGIAYIIMYNVNSGREDVE